MPLKRWAGLCWIAGLGVEVGVVDVNPHEIGRPRAGGELHALLDGILQIHRDGLVTAPHLVDEIVDLDPE